MLMRFSRSRELQTRIRRLVPGGCHAYAKGEDQYPELSPGFIAKGAGCHVWDVDGNEFIEYGMGLRSVTLGHAYPPVVEAVCEALTAGTNFTRPAPIELECAEALLGIVDGADMVKFTKDGSTATTAALRLARAFTGREVVGICDEHPFFSYDDWFIATTTMDSGVPASARTLTVPFHFNDLGSAEALFASHPKRVAALLLEPAHDREPIEGFLSGLQNLCRRHGDLRRDEHRLSVAPWWRPEGLRGDARPLHLR
jgi:glutamate-1-semialdehyde 2,1-aminomutase